MFRTKGNFAVILLMVFVSLSLALQTVDDGVRKLEKRVAETGRRGRFLIPADFAVKKKKFSVGTEGVGTFFRAWRNCIDEGKSLATIESAEEQSFLQNMLQSIAANTRYWIAATNLGGGANYTLTWITTDLPVLNYPDYLDIESDNCITLSSAGFWKGHDCYSATKRPYLCEAYY